MTRLPRLTGRRVIAALKKAGFVVVRIKRSHHFLIDPDRRATSVPVHFGGDHRSRADVEDPARLRVDGRRIPSIARVTAVDPSTSPAHSPASCVD